MKIEDYEKRLEFKFVGGGFIALNQAAQDLQNNCVNGEIVSFLEITSRDIKFHRCFFDLLGFIYDYLPDIFKNRIPKNKFYLVLKDMQGKYDIIYKSKSGSEIKEYHSISFGKMSQKAFEDYVREQITFIYNNVLSLYFDGEIFNSIIETIEENYKNFLARL